MQENMKFKIVFTGELQQGQDLLSVKTRIASMLNASGDMVEHLFVGEPVLIKGNMTLDEARLFQMKFEMTGAKCQLLESSSIPIPVQKIAAIDARQMPSFTANTQVPIVSRPETALPRSQPSAAAAARLNSEFTFQKPQRKSKLPIILAIFGILIVVSVIINFTERNRQQAEAYRRYQGSRTTNKTGANSTQTRPSPGTNQRQVPTKNILDGPLKPYVDPKNYYSVALPEGYKIRNKSSGSRSKITFSYSNNVSVTILASPMRKVWNPDLELSNKVAGIQRGSAGPFSGYQIERAELLSFNDMRGYELLLTRGSNIAQAYAMVSSSSIAFAVSIVTLGKNSREYNEILADAIRESLFPN